MRATEHRDLDLCAKRRLGEGDRNLTVEVVAFSGEEIVRLNSYLDDKIATRATVSTGRALTSQSYVLIVVDTCGDIYLEFLVYLYEALAVTVLTGSLNDLTCTATA